VYGVRFVAQFFAHPEGCDDGGFADGFLSYLAQFFKPVKDLATMTNTIAQTAVGVDRVQAILNASDVIPEKEDAIDPGPLKGNIEFERIVSATQGRARIE